MSSLLQSEVSDLASVSLSFSGEEMAQLKKIQFQQRFARKRGLILMLVFLVGVVPFLLGVFFDQIWLVVLGGTLGLAGALILVGWFIVFLPKNETISKRWKKIVLPHLLHSIGLQGEYHTAHDLAVKTFLNAGLFKEKYSYFSREDCFLLQYQNARFGLYQLAVQYRLKQDDFLTNHFYGLVLHVPLQKKFNGVWIIPKNRRTAHESDDWLLPVLEYRHKKEGIVAVQSGHPEFDACFFVFCYQPQEAAIVLKPWFCSLLYRVQQNWENGLAISFVDQLAALHVGHATPKFDLDSNQDALPVAPDAQLQVLREFTLLATTLHETAHLDKFDGKQYDNLFL
ncbi:MAG: DUF3137 domain-containing protein [Bacteroidia bacterium]